MSNIITDLFQSLAICILIIGYLLNARAIRRHQPTATQHITFDYKEPEAVCGCKHHQCFHDENGCGQIWWSGVNKITCGCKRYTGPEPLPQVIP